MKRVCLRKALVVADFFITFCLREPQATVGVVLMRVMKVVVFRRNWDFRGCLLVLNVEFWFYLNAKGAKDVLEFNFFLNFSLIYLLTFKWLEKG
jgi:hypothetical protein